jgi:DNA mismatch repair protein MutS
VLKKLDEKDIMDMTPMDAMNFLYKLKQDLKSEN